MKTAISIPEKLFKKADTTARKMRLSRSALFCRAVKEFVEVSDNADVTEKLNQIYSSHSSRLDPSLLDAQSRSLAKEDW